MYGCLYADGVPEQGINVSFREMSGSHTSMTANK
jgi:hypothetical protein